MKRFLISFCVLAIGFDLAAQQTPGKTSGPNCTQVLRLARATYEQGRLHELETLLDGCIKEDVGASNGFQSKAEKVDALKILTLAYIYLEEPTKADESMRKLLETDHFFKYNETDPAEFKALYSTFRTQPVFSFGARLAFNLNMNHLHSNYYVWGNAAGNAKYSPSAAFGGGIFVEKAFFTKSKNLLAGTVLRFEGAYHNRNFNIKNPILEKYSVNTGTADFTAPAVKSSEAKTSTSWIDMNLIVRYRLQWANISSTWDPYIGVGPGFSLLLNAKVSTAKLERRKLLDANGTIINSDSYSGPEINKVTQPNEVNVKNSFKPTVTSISALAGVNRKVGEFYINAEVRYQYGFGNRIIAKNRTIPQLTYDYGIIFDDYTFSNVQIVAGVTFPYFKPKKLIKRKK